MSTWVMKASRSGRVTLPAAVRRTLGIEPGDKLVIALVEGKAEPTRIESVTSYTAGSLKTGKPGISAEELCLAAEEAIAEDVMRGMRER